MVTITKGATTYEFKQVEDERAVTTDFANARYLNAGNKIEVTLGKPSCEKLWWHTYLSSLVGEVVTVDGLQPDSFQALISDESTLELNSMNLVMYDLAYDTRGLI